YATAGAFVGQGASDTFAAAASMALDTIMEAPDLLDWMGVWVDLDEGDDWPLNRRRALVAAAPSIYRMRGTRGGVKKHLSIYTGGMVLIEERTNGFRLDGDTRLGINSSIGENRPGIFTVTIAVPNPDDLDINTIRAIIEADKPVETGYILRVVKVALVQSKQRRKAFDESHILASQPGVRTTY
ncbi:MAG: phage tail protein, partial [Chloroflexota bacterium]|nr:phage tail protein [Chloroflexota bacterium]